MKTKIILLTLGLTLSIIGCDHTKKESKKDNFVDIEWETIEAHETYTSPEITKAFPNDSIGYTFQADYTLVTPKTKDGSHTPFIDYVAQDLISRLDTLKTNSQEQPITRLKKYLDSQLEDHKSVIKNIEDLNDFPFYSLMYEHTMSDSIVLNQNGIVSIFTYNYMYTGGAHGNWGHSGYNYDFNRETKLTEKTLFKEGVDAEINELICHQLMSDHGVHDKQVLRDSLNIDFEYVVMNDNFYLTSDGISYIYTPYEIQPYAYGETYVHLPYSALSPYLREEYKYLAD